jgi:peptidoglycan/LPS O-acetylase OafA/YrhL
VAFRAVTDRGYLGVDFFFVLSGFIITRTNLGKTRRPGWTRRYAESRLARIFVPYLPVGIALAAAYTLLPALSGSSRVWGWWATLTLLPSKADPALLVAWTLQHELVFYGLFWLFARTVGPLVGAIIWAAAIGIAWWISPALERPWSIGLSPIDIEFLFGMAVAWLTTRSLPSWPFLLGGGVLLGTYAALGAQVDHRVLFALSVAMLLVTIVQLEQDGRIRAPRMGVFLGDASYAIYLVHMPIVSLLARAMPAHWLASFLILFAIGAGSGVAYHLLLERPALALVRRRLAMLPYGATARNSSTSRGAWVASE